MTANGHVDMRGTLAPPIIMRTAATPMPTPKSSLGAESVLGSGIIFGEAGPCFGEAGQGPLTSTWFEHVSMLVILLNCVTLGMFQPCEDVTCQTDWCLILQVLDDCIFAFFAVEMVIKMMALGIFGSKCYLGDTWNRLDFFIVMAGMMEYSLDGHNASLSAIRTVRVLRPLRAINRVPSKCSLPPPPPPPSKAALPRMLHV
ncbi:voltage-dependent T-type calcium channel subunit alpha-1H-like [Gadus macrocephalus]|uniref:voltage-dependent T-type calcium channel subunit alpha-1H-like n=1 Tax=Gadus macrocephalus TaxID=80720 RepID=UPI0028CB698A|nr:voltage-dependent T-type calcium channel subunit alpha-1H-like [Gadus macrocephalus]